MLVPAKIVSTALRENDATYIDKRKNKIDKQQNLLRWVFIHRPG